MRQILFGISLLLKLVSLIEAEGSLLLLGESNRVLLDLKSSHLIGLLDRLVSRNKYLRRNGLASELLFHVFLLIKELLLHHLLDFLLSDGLSACLLPEIEVEWLRHRHAILTLTALRPLSVVLCRQLSTSELFLIEGTADVAAFSRLRALTAT